MKTRIVIMNQTPASVANALFAIARSELTLEFATCARKERTKGDPILAICPCHPRAAGGD